MRRENVGFLPVVDAAGKIVGVLTDRDLAMRVVADHLPFTTEARFVMTLDVVSISENADLAVAEKTMADARKSRLPLVNEDGVCTGVLSLADVAALDSRWRAGKVFQQVTRRESDAGRATFDVV
jgi:CBS domain-containing protein